MTEPQHHAATPSVLLVEDEPSLRELITLLLEDLGATVTALPSADEGIAVLKLKPWALVITDVRTPGVSNGLQLACIARRDLPVTGVIVTSGYHPQINEALPHGIRYLPKPWAVEEFIELVRPFLFHQVDQRPAA